MAPLRDPGPPWVIALLRGTIEAALLAALGVVITGLSGVDGGELAPWAPIGVLALRQLEGVVDQIDPAHRRAPGGDG